LLSYHDIYTRYYEDVYSFSYHLCGNVEDAKDITSETFVRVWASLDRLMVKTLKAYLLTIAKNIYLHQIRRPTADDLDFDPIDNAHSAERRGEDRAQLDQVLHNMQSLSPIDRSVLLMRAQHGIPYSDIATSFNISVAAAKVKVHRARLKLKSMQNPKKGIK